MIASEARKIADKISKEKNSRDFDIVIKHIENAIKNASENGYSRCQHTVSYNLLEFVDSNKIDEYFKKNGYNISHYPSYSKEKYRGWKEFHEPSRCLGLIFTISW